MSDVDRLVVGHVEVGGDIHGELDGRKGVSLVDCVFCALLGVGERVSSLKYQVSFRFEATWDGPVHI